MASFCTDIPLAELAGIWQRTFDFFYQGGIIMGFIVLCSVLAIAVVLFQLNLLRNDRVLPPKIISELDRLPEFAKRHDIVRLQSMLKEDDSALSRSAWMAISGNFPNKAEAEKAVEGKAREELHRLEWGTTILDVIITIAPLLGLFGTVSGLVSIFATLGQSGAEGSADMPKIASGIALALNTTIAGLAVAVPCVVAHGFITRKIESLSVRMEVILNRSIMLFYRHFEVREEN
jgi:biopolymer transport protein ExbB